VSPSTEQRFREVASGGNHTCALTLDDVAWCWGAQTAGNLGDGVGLESGGVPIGRPVPEPVPTTLRFRTLSAGAHTCGITLDAELWCWGPGYGNRPVKVILPAID
jgi:alpha-tubulin suppressor-like RCC1 family protein